MAIGARVTGATVAGARVFGPTGATLAGAPVTGMKFCDVLGGIVTGGAETA